MLWHCPRVEIVLAVVAFVAVVAVTLVLVRLSSPLCPKCGKRMSPEIKVSFVVVEGFGPRKKRARYTCKSCGETKVVEYTRW